LDKEALSNYRPISNLSFLSKLNERIVKDRITHHLCTNSMFSSFQSAYLKHHYTETTLIALHDDLIRAMDKQEVTCLTILDLSATFDTIDHSILLQRLSLWFGLHGTVLSWFSSYLSDRTFTLAQAVNHHPHDLRLVFPRVLYWDQSFSFFILPPSAHSSANLRTTIIIYSHKTCLRNITYMQMTLIFIFLIVLGTSLMHNLVCKEKLLQSHLG